MKKSALLYLALIVMMIGACKKETEKEFDYGTIHVYTPEEIQKFVDNAESIEMKGDPIVKKSDNPGDSSTMIITTQAYLVRVNVSDGGHLLPKGETGTTTTARQGGRPGTVVVSAVCGMNCKMTGTDKCTDASGCVPTRNCGCSQGSCGSACTTTSMCSPSLTGFGFGGGIKM